MAKKHDKKNKTKLTKTEKSTNNTDEPVKVTLGAKSFNSVSVRGLQTQLEHWLQANPFDNLKIVDTAMTIDTEKGTLRDGRRAWLLVTFSYTEPLPTIRVGNNTK